MKSWELWLPFAGKLRITGYGVRATILVAIYLVHGIVVHSDVYLSREPYNEIATNYIKQADTGVASLLLLDAGYPSVLLRLLAWSVSEFPLEVQPVMLGILALLLPLVAVVPFLSIKFRPIVRDDLARFLICLAVLMFPSWETRLFLSFPYIFFFSIFLLLTLKAPIRSTKSAVSLLPLFVTAKPIVAAAAAASSTLAFVWTKRSSFAIAVTGFSSVLFLAYLSMTNSDRPTGELMAVVVAAMMWIEFLGVAPLAPLQRLLPLPVALALGLLILAFLHYWWSVKNRKAVILYSAHAAILGNFGLLAISLPNQWTIANLDVFVYFSFRQFSPAWQMAFLLLIPPLVEVIRRAFSHLSRRSVSMVLALIVPVGAITFSLVSPNPLLDGISDTSGKASWWSKMVLLSKAKKPSEIPPCTPINPLGTILDPSECTLTLGARIAESGRWEPISGEERWIIEMGEKSPKLRVLAAMVRQSAEESVCLTAETIIEEEIHDVETVCTHSRAELLGWYLTDEASVNPKVIQLTLSGNGEMFVSIEGNPLIVAADKMSLND